MPNDINLVMDSDINTFILLDHPDILDLTVRSNDPKIVHQPLFKSEQEQIIDDFYKF